MYELPSCFTFDFNFPMQTIIPLAHLREWKTGLTVEELLEVATQLRNNIVMDVRVVNFCVTPEKIQKIVKLVPVMYMHSKSKSLFVNMHEFVYTPGALEALLMCQDNNEEPTNEISVDVGKNNNSC